MIAFGALILGAAGLARAGSGRLTAPAWVYLGEISFSIYMVCIPFQLLVENGSHKLLHLQGDSLPLPLWLAMVAGVVPAAVVLHHLVELPARAVMRRRGVPFTGAPKAAAAKPVTVRTGKPVFQS